MVRIGRMKRRDGVICLDGWREENEREMRALIPETDTENNEDAAVLRFIYLFLVDSRSRSATEIRVEVKSKPWARVRGQSLTMPRLVASYVIEGEMVEIMHAPAILREAVFHKLREMGTRGSSLRMATGEISVRLPKNGGDRQRIWGYELFVRGNELAILFVLSER